MPGSRQSLLDLIEEIYGTRHPDFDSIRRQYERILQESQDKGLQRDARLLLAGLDAARNTYKDWEDLSDYERENALKAIEWVRGLTTSVLEKYDVEVG